MEVSGQVLEAAAQSMYHGTLAQQQEAANFFSSWQNSNNALISSVRFLSFATDSSDALEFITCCVILYASDQWFKYDRNILNEIRSMMLQYTFTKQHNPITSAKLDEIIAKMAFNDWPEQWEDFIPQLQSFIINDSSEIDFNSQTHVFTILSIFLNMISNSPKISLKRRAMMIEVFIQIIPSIIQNYMTSSGNKDTNGLSDDPSSYKINSSNIDKVPSSVVEAFLEFAKSLCSIIGNNTSMTISFTTYMFITFVNIPQYAEKSLIAISELFSPSSYLTHLIPYMMKLIVSYESEEASISLTFHEFVCTFLIKFLNIADTYITSDEIAQPIQKLFQVSLNSAPRDTFCQHFWTLWNECLSKISNGLLKSLHPLLSPLFSLIISTSIDLLPCSMQLSRLISPLTSSTFQSLMKISPDETINFINSQQPSISQCISIGIIQHPSFLPKIKELVKECTSMNEITVLSAVLYMISRNISLMKANPELISTLQQLSFNYLLHSDDDNYHTSVLLSLNHVASSFPNALTSNTEFINLLFECASFTKDSSLRLQEEDFSRLCRILAKVIMTTPQDVRSSYIKRLIDIAAIPLTSADLIMISLGCRAAWAISSISICGSYLITKFLWSPLLVAMEFCAQQQGDENGSYFADIVAVFASSVRLAPFGLCRKSILKFIEIAKQYVTIHSEKATPVLDAFNSMLQCHLELIDFRDTFASTFVRGMAECPQPSFFEFFSIAGLNENEQQVVMSAACNSIKDADLNISKNAAHLLKTLINKQKNSNFLTSWQLPIMKAVFDALFDELHKAIVSPISKVLFAIYKQHLKRNSLSQDLDHIVVEAIESTVGDQNVTLAFANALRNAASNKDDFLLLIKDFLIAFGRCNPTEIKLFDDSLEVRSLAYDIGKTSIQGSPAEIKNEDEYMLDCIY